MALDGAVCAVATVEKLEKAFAAKQIAVCDKDLTGAVWTQDRPPLPATPAWLLDVQYAGKTAREKLADVRAALGKAGAQATLVSRLDSVAWLLNLRAADIDYNPFALAYCLVTEDAAQLFIDTGRLPAPRAPRWRARASVCAPIRTWRPPLPPSTPTPPSSTSRPASPTACSALSFQTRT